MFEAIIYFFDYFKWAEREVAKNVLKLKILIGAKITHTESDVEK